MREIPAPRAVSFDGIATMPFHVPMKAAEPNRIGGAAGVLLTVAALIVWALAPAASAQEPVEPPSPRVVVVPVHGQIGTTTVYLVNRAVRAALSESMSRIVLDIDTPGGPITAMREIESILAALEGTEGIRTTAYVTQRAWSAGGYIALACDETYMAPGASIGAITPVEVGPGGIQQIADDDARAKILSIFRADVRALLEDRGTLSEGALTVAEAMVDPRMEVFRVAVVEPNGLERMLIVDGTGLRELEARDVEIRSRELIGRGPLTLTAEEALRFGFSSGTYTNLDALAREQFGIDPSEIVRLEQSWSESAVSWLEMMKPLLFVLGFVLLLVELKVPGLGIPGVVGVVLISLGLFSSYLVGLADWTEILLFFLGLVLIGIEMFVMPGTIVFGFVGFLFLVAALVLSQQTFLWPDDATQQDILVGNLLNLLYLILLVMAGSIVFYRLMPRIPFFNRALLALPDHAATGDSTRFARAEAESRQTLLGVVGVAVTDLRPSGILEADAGDRFDVVSQGSFVPRGTRVRVVDVTGNRIVVSVEDPERGETSLGVLFLLVVVGLALVIAEVFFISGGLLSIGAAVALVSAIFLAFTQHGETVGFLFLASAAIGVPVVLAFALKLLPRTALGKKILLEGPAHETVQGAAQAQGLARLLGLQGVTESVLRPTGYARIDGRRVDVITRGELIESGERVRVIRVEGNRVVVAAAPVAHGEPPSS